MTKLRFCSIFLIIFSICNSSFAFVDMFDAESEKTISVNDEVMSQVNQYKSDAKIYFKEKNIEAVLDKYEKLYQLIDLYDLAEERLNYYLFLTKVNYYQRDNLALLTNLNSAMLVAIEIDDKEKLAYIYSRMGYVHYEESNLILARSMVFHANEIFADTGNEKGLLETYYNLAIINKNLDKQDEVDSYNQLYESLLPKYPDLDFHKLDLEQDHNSYLNIRNKFASEGFIEANIANVQILNKVTARVYDFKIKVGHKIKFENIDLTVRSCWKSPSDQLPNNYAFLEVMDNKNFDNIFYGWVLSSNPGLNSLAHQFYNISLSNCITKDYK
ncbi:MAG: DUF2155 domain-containing protein [Rickettsiales bacterium]|nr:DUF2155 domain-containing protein [Rickettsiales bacterium]